MKNTFIKLLDVKLGFKLKDHRYKLRRDTPFEKAYSDSIKNDSLKNLENQRVQTARYYIISAAKLIAPKLDIEFGGKFGKGFDWCVEEVKKKENLDTLVNELEVEKTLALLRVGLPKKAEELLKKFEKKEETPIRAVACNNLSFMHLEQNNIPLAHKFADLALRNIL